MYMCSKNNGAMAKSTAIPQEEEVTDQDINYLISQILSLFSDVLEQAEDADKEVVERHIKYTKKIKLNARRHNVKFRSIQII